MDLALALHFIRNRHPSSPLIGIGFSLGASVISRYLGEYGSSSILSAGVVLGCPWDLTAMSHKLEDAGSLLGCILLPLGGMFFGFFSKLMIKTLPFLKC